MPTHVEVQVFGRQTLSVAMRCYHARSHNLTKDHCQLVCGLDTDGLAASTIDGTEILTINGTQTLSHGYCVLLPELGMLREIGVTALPAVAAGPRHGAGGRDSIATVLDGKRVPRPRRCRRFASVTGDIPYVNGFLHGREGLGMVGGARRSNRSGASAVAGAKSQGDRE